PRPTSTQSEITPSRTRRTSTRASQRASKSVSTPWRSTKSARLKPSPSMATIPPRMTHPPNPTPAEPRVWVTNPARAGLLGWLFRYGLFAALLLLLAGGVGGLKLYRYYAQDLPDIRQAEHFENYAPGITRVYAADGTVLREL